MSHASLRQVIAQEIRQRGPIPFSRYMELCLYHPRLGYYSRAEEKFGKAGDFYTSSDVHAVFGRLLCRQFEEMWRALGRPERIEVIELGPGRGLFAQDVLAWAEKKFPEFYAAVRYRLVEGSEGLRGRLRELFAEQIAAGKVEICSELRPGLKPVEAARETAGLKPGAPTGADVGATPGLKPVEAADEITGLKPGAPTGGGDGGAPTGGGQDAAPGLKPVEAAHEITGLKPGAPTESEDGGAPTGPAATIVFANEFFDALPVEVVAHQGRVLVGVEQEQTTEATERFTEEFGAVPEDVLEFLDRYSVQPQEQERVEAIPGYREHVQRIAAAVQRGFCVFIDYGYTREELLAGRHRGTVAAFRRHTMSASPYEAPGEQDITAHVNFTAIAEMAREFGLDPQPLVTQSQFLLGIGEANQFADAFEDCRLPQEHAKVALQLKHLVTPAGMGETFHVLLAAKGVDASGVSGLSWSRRR